MNEINELLEIMRTLRDPQKGCPWDRDQTINTIMPYTLEEAYELADAVDRNDMQGLCGELGDLLFHIVYYAQIASEQGLFDFRQITSRINLKLRERHPHVFAGSRVDTAEEQSVEWEKIKRGERKQHKNHSSLLDGINHAQPAMSRAHILQKRAASAGFDWDGTDGVFDKIKEEVLELRNAVQSGRGREVVEEELGDVLFACINLARHTSIDPESALRKTNHKFERRFRYIEQELASAGRDIVDVSLDDMELLWEQAKESEE